MTTKPCPCCNHRSGEIHDLCENCIHGVLVDGGCQIDHGPKPVDDFTLLQALPPVDGVIEVAAVRHLRGRAWPWGAASAGLGDGCAHCRPAIRCWRHTVPHLDLIGYVSRFEPVLGANCLSGRAKGACTGRGGITVVHAAGMNASVCGPCALATLGPQVELEPAR